MARAKECVNRVELIVCAAQELFSKYGFERTTIDDIARQAGIGKGSVYLEFENKDEILMAVIRKFAESSQSMMETHLNQAAAPYLDALKQMLMDSIMSSYDVCTGHLHTPEIRIHTSRNVRSQFKDYFAFSQKIIVQFLEKASANGELVDTESLDRLADLIMLACSGLKPPYLQYRIPSNEETPTRISIENDANELLDILIQGLGKNIPRALRS